MYVTAKKFSSAVQNPFGNEDRAVKFLIKQLPDLAEKNAST